MFTSGAIFSAIENQTSIGSVTATDSDSSSITFSVSGAELAITSDGVLSFVSAPDYETKSRYTATVTATDGTNPSTQSITVNVTDVDDINFSPVFLSASVCSKSNENILIICDLEGADGNGDDLIYSISGADAGNFVVQSNSMLSFKVNPDFESPQDSDTNNVYEFSINISDGENITSQAIKMKLTNVEENQLGEGLFGTSVTE